MGSVSLLPREGEVEIAKKIENEENPLELVADSFRSRASVICLDELFVSDIGDAMISNWVSNNSKKVSLSGGSSLFRER